MKRNVALWIALAGVGLLAFGAAGCTKLRARDHLNKGVQAYRNAQYPLAVEQFKAAIDLEPTFATARLYLATAYMSQYVPGAESEENTQMAQRAYDEFHTVLDADPGNSIALQSIASLFFHQKKFEEAEQWYEKVIGVDPNNKEAFYTMGVIAWTRAFQDRMKARAELGMKPEDPGPLKDKKIRDQLRETNLPVIEEGLKNLQQAVKIDKEYDDAMAYINLLYRERADLANSKEEFEADSRTADDWVDKTLQTKKLKAARNQPGFGITDE
ncbi:MAG: tetratricopeptide repeat protein [Bryobacteraceae bacterium]|nr:tetratricopeptide repeat protein [Bryobacteraceae bacterium]